MTDPGSYLTVPHEHSELVEALRELAIRRPDLIDRRPFTGPNGPEAIYALSYEGAKWMAQRLAP